MKSKSWFAVPISALALLFGSMSAHATGFVEFTVDEGVVPGAAPQLITANNLTGKYTEVLTIDGSGNVFFQGFVTWASYALDGATVGSQLGGSIPGVTQTYNAYSVFAGTGTFTPSATGGTFSIDVATFNFYIDPNQDSTATFGATGLIPVAVSNTGDDLLVAEAASLLTGSGIAGTPGAFQAIWDDLILTTFGESFFIAPRPFFMTVETTGDFDEDTFTGGTFTLTGDVSANFLPVPEPSTVALFALGLLGLAGLMRRREST